VIVGRPALPPAKSPLSVECRPHDHVVSWTAFHGSDPRRRSAQVPALTAPCNLRVVRDSLGVPLLRPPKFLHSDFYPASVKMACDLDAATQYYGY
jgi:hypothetical protein